MRFSFFVLLSVLTVSCAPIYVSYDYDSAANFSNYKTYQYFGDLDTGFSELDTKRLLDAVDSTLYAKGFRIADAPDILIDIKSTAHKNIQRETIGVGVGGTGGNLGGGITIGLPIGQQKTTQHITFEFLDAKNKQLFWQAKSESSFNANAAPVTKEARFIAIVEKVFKKYPLLPVE
jgi:hypothetical protein